MEVKIGITNVNRELSIETTEAADDIATRLEKALSDASVFSITDDKGRRVLIPVTQLAYLDLGSETARPVGFGTI